MWSQWAPRQIVSAVSNTHTLHAFGANFYVCLVLPQSDEQGLVFQAQKLFCKCAHRCEHWNKWLNHSAFLHAIMVLTFIIGEHF